MNTTEKMLNLAASFNYFTFKNLPTNILKDSYFYERLEYYTNQFNLKKIPDFLINSKNYNVGIFAKVNTLTKSITEEFQGFYIDKFYIIVYCEKTNTIMQLMTHKNKFSFYPIYELMNQYNFLSYEQKKPYLNKVIQPNEIGVFTDKKISDYVIYCNDYLNALNDCKNSILSKKNENELKIDNTINSLDNCKVQRFNNYTIIDTKLFTIEFELTNNGAYLSQKIKYNGTLNDIINFNL